MAEISLKNFDYKEHIHTIGVVGVSVLITLYTGTITLSVIFLATCLVFVSIKSKATGSSSSSSDGSVPNINKEIDSKIGKIGGKLSSAIDSSKSKLPNRPPPPTPSPNKQQSTQSTQSTPSTPSTPTPKTPSTPVNTNSPSVISTPSTPIRKPSFSTPESVVSNLPSTPVNVLPPFPRPTKSAPTSPLVNPQDSPSTAISKTIKKKAFPTIKGIIDAVKNISTSDSQKRKHIADEILQTEKIYVGKLKVIVEVYYHPLKQSSHLTHDQVQTIFGEIETIYNYNVHFYERLEERMKSSSNSVVFGDIFISIIDFLKTYSVYINNYTKSLKMLESVRKNSSIDALFQQYATNPACDSLDLNSLLIMPVQRIPRYILLLTEMVKNTDKGSTDYDNLNKALSKMKDLAAEMNENRREAELLNSMYDIQLRLDGFKENYGDFLLPHRKIILDTEFTEKSLKLTGSGNNGRSSNRRYILCNDILIRTSPSGKKLKVKEVIDVDHIIFKDDDTTSGKVLSFQTSSTSDILVLKSLDDNEDKWRDTILHQQKVNRENKTSFAVKRESNKWD